jgi:hypothetical protein
LAKHRFATSPIFAADGSRPKRTTDPVVSLLPANLNRPPANPAMYQPSNQLLAADRQ